MDETRVMDTVRFGDHAFWCRSGTHLRDQQAILLLCPGSGLTWTRMMDETSAAAGSAIDAARFGEAADPTVIAAHLFTQKRETGC